MNSPRRIRGYQLSQKTTPKGVEQIFNYAYRQIFYQIVFGTKNREKTISEAFESELYKYIWGIIKEKKCTLYRINSMPDHIHIFSDLHPAICLSDLVKDIKIASNIWMKSSGKFPLFYGWQDAYAAFTYSIREKDMIIEYIKNQKEHHKNESFFDEYKRLLIENARLTGRAGNCI